MVRSVSSRIKPHKCAFCSGPTCEVALESGHARSPRHIRVIHAKGCVYWESIVQQWPRLMRMREPAAFDFPIGFHEGGAVS